MPIEEAGFPKDSSDNVLFAGQGIDPPTHLGVVNGINFGGGGSSQGTVGYPF